MAPNAMKTTINYLKVQTGGPSKFWGFISQTTGKRGNHD